jgi:hypothetical protein
MGYGLTITHHNFESADENIRFYLNAGLFLDDAFYYYKTALNFTNSGIASFDRINPTNGFHPLWFLICAPLVAILSPAHFLDSIIWIEILLYFSSAFFLVKAADVKQHRLLINIICISLMTSHYFTRINFNGLETSLFIFSISLALYSFRQYLNDKNWLPILASSLLIVFLSRLDGLLLTAIICLIIVYKKRWGDGLKIAVTVTFTALTYFILNQITIGEALPISGLTKEVYALSIHNAELQKGISQVSLWFNYFSWPTKNPYFLSVLLINLLAIPIYFYKKEYIGLSFSIFIVLKFIVYVIKYKSTAGFYLWYYSPDFIAAIYFIIYITNILLKKYNYKIILLILTFASLFHIRNEFLILRANMNHHFVRVHNIEKPFIGSDLDMYYLSSSLINDAKLPPKTIIGMHNSGVFGFFSDYRVVNMDGLINGKIRLSFNRKHPYDWLEYMDTAQPIDIYFDLIPPANVIAYSSPLAARGFSIHELTESNFEKFGFFSKPKDEFNLMLYSKPGFELRGN